MRILPKSVLALDLVRISFGKCVGRVADPLVLYEVMVRNRHVYLLTKVVLSVLRENFMEETHVVQDLLAIYFRGLLTPIPLLIH